MGELKLWASVLIVAAREILDDRGNSHDLVRHFRRRTALEWFASEENDVGGFLWVSDQLGIDGPSFRRRLFRQADREERYRSGKSQGDIVDPGAIAYEVFGDFTSENEKVSNGIRDEKDLTAGKDR